MTRSQGVTFWQIARPARRKLIGSAILALLASLLSLAPVVVLAELARAVLEDSGLDPFRLAMLIGALVAATILHDLCLRRSYAISHTADGVLAENIRQRQITKLSLLPLSWFTQTSSGKVKKAILDDVAKVHMLVAHGAPDVTSAVMVPVLSLAYIFFLDWRLGVVALAPVVLAAATLPFVFRDHSELAQGYGTSLKELNSSIVELVRGISVIKVFQPAGKDQGVFLRRSREFASFYLSWVRATVHPFALAQIFSSPLFGLLLVALTGPWMVFGHGVSPITVMAALLLIGNIASPLLMLARMGMMFKEAENAATELTEFFALPAPPRADRTGHPTDNSIAFRDVSFSYVDDTTVLDGISERLAPGSVTALVGPSGAGKSTLAQLVPRLLDPTQGTVQIGGVATTDLSTTSLYEQVGFVFQDPYLLRLSVRDNIRLATPDASNEHVVRAARAAQIHDTIVSLPRGYDSVVGEDARLSGGEQQRVAIARAILHDAPVLVLDEATAFADPDSEAAIQRAVTALVADRTLIVIAHRLHTIIDADTILVLESGRVIARGTHAELLAAGGRYAAMWRRYEHTRHSLGETSLR